MYKVQIVCQRTGYKKKRFEGIYLPPPKRKLSVTEMKAETVDFVRKNLIAHNVEFANFEYVVTIFKRLRTDFIVTDARDKTPVLEAPDPE